MLKVAHDTCKMLTLLTGFIN